MIIGSYRQVMRRLTLVLTTILMIATEASCKCGYAVTFQDFVQGKWVPLDTVYCKKHSKGHKIMWGSSDYKLTSNNKEVDKVLKQRAFAVTDGNAIYLNCRNLRYKNLRFGKGYSKAACIDEHDLLFTNAMLVDTWSKMRGTTAVMGGAFGGAAIGAMIGGGIAAKNQLKNQVCYIISSSADDKGRYDVKLIDDHMMDKLLLNRDLTKLHDIYYSEKDKAKRMAASRIIPILEKADIIEPEE